MPAVKKIVMLTVLAMLGLFIYYQVFHDPCGDGFFNSKTTNNKRLLIANEGSHFKDSVVHILLRHYHTKSVNIKTITLKSLSEEAVKEYDALLIIHSWYTWRPPVEVEQFIKNQSSCTDKIVVLTTSFHGGLKMDGVDAITGASILADAERYASEIIERLTPILQK